METESPKRTKAMEKEMNFFMFSVFGLTSANVERESDFTG
jgi:hypothetical protein